MHKHMLQQAISSSDRPVSILTFIIVIIFVGKGQKLGLVSVKPVFPENQSYILIPGCGNNIMKDVQLVVCASLGSA